MAGLDMNNFIPTPLKDALDVERIQGAQYQNMLTQQAMQQEAEKRRGYESAYQNMLAQQQMPQQQPQMETVEPPPLSPLTANIGGSFQYQPEQQAPWPQQPYQAPAGSSYGYIQGAEQQNALFQQQQQEYYKTSVAPLLDFFIKQGDDAGKTKLIEQLQASSNPVAGMAKQIVALMKDTTFSSPGVIENIVLTPETKSVLKGANPTIQAAIDSFAEGDKINVTLDEQERVIKIGSPKPYGWSDERLALERDKLGLRGKQLEKQREELGLKYDPEVQGAVTESKEASKVVGKQFAEGRVELPKLERKLAGLTRLEKMIDDNPNALGKFTKYKTQIASLINPAAIEAVSDDVVARRQMEARVASLIDNDLKKMFGPPFSDNDLKIMFQMTGADLNSPASVKEAIRQARETVQGDYDTAKSMYDVRRPTTTPRIVKPTESGKYPPKAQLTGQKKTHNEILADYMKAHPKATRDQIKASSAFQNDLKKYGAL